MYIYYITECEYLGEIHGEFNSAVDEDGLYSENARQCWKLDLEDFQVYINMQQYYMYIYMWVWVCGY